MMARPKVILLFWFRPGLFGLLIGPSGLKLCSSFALDVHWCCLAVQGSPAVTNTLHLWSSRLCFFIVLNRDFFAYRDGS